MKFARRDNRSALSARRLALALTVAALVPLLLYGGIPSWWVERVVLLENATADDYAPVNQGQLKNIAKAAVAEMDAKLSGGAGNELHALIDSWSSSSPGTNDFAPVNLGQLKNVSRLFFDRLISAGMVDHYPWESSLNAADDFAVANIGQVKSLFAFDLPTPNFLQDPLADRITAGEHSANLALQSNAVWSWSSNSGLAPDFDRNYPRRVSGLSGIRSVSSGDRHLVALGIDGRVFAWGENNAGQLGDDTYAQRNAPAVVPNLANIVSVKAGAHYSLALQPDGTVLAWGDNYYGQLGSGDTTPSSIPKLIPGLEGVRKIAAGYARSVALTNDGTVWTWGYDHYAGQDIFKVNPIAMPDVFDVVDIAAGYEHSIVIKADGTVWAWGSNYTNQLGDGSPRSTFQDVPVQVISLTDIVRVVSSYDHSLALKRDGTVWAWGRNSSGQLGDGTNQTPQTPVHVSGLSDVIGIATAYSYSLAMKADGTVWAWGEGATGTMPGSDPYVPQQVGLGLFDPNQNGMDDRWEMYFIGNLDQSPDADFDGDGISNRQEFLRGTNPADYFNGVTPIIEIAGGNNQIGDPGTFLGKPLKVRVKNPAGQILINAPVTFAVVDGYGALALSVDGNQQQSLGTRTDATGEALAYHALPAGAGTSTRTIANAAGTSVSASATFRSIVKFSLPSTPTPSPTPPDPNATPTPTPSPTASPIPPYRYAIIDLGKDMYPIRLNNPGHVLIQGPDSTGQWGTFRWKGGVLERLTYVATNNEMVVRDMNDAGVVVGSFPEIGPWKANNENEVGGGLVWPANLSNATKVSAPSAFRTFEPQLPGTFRQASLRTINNAGDLFGQVCTGSVRGFLNRTLRVLNSAVWTAAESPPDILGDASAVNNPSDSETSIWQGSLDTITRANSNGRYIGRKLTPTSPMRTTFVVGTQSGMIDKQAVPFDPVDLNEEGIVVGSAGADMVVYVSPASQETIGGASPLAINDHRRPAPSPSSQPPATGPSPTPIRVPQILGWAGNAIVLWERDQDNETWHPFGLEEMIPQMDGWQYLEPYDMNDTGAIVGRAGYTDPSIPNAAGEFRTFLLVPVELVPDYNRDGTIDDADRGRISESERWRWWINDDDDELDTGGKDIPGALNSNFETTPILSGMEVGTINGIRDLVDFFPLYLDIRRLLELFPADGPSACTFNLKQENGSSNFVYTDLRPVSASAYRRQLTGTALDNATTLGGTTLSNGAPTHRITMKGVALDPSWLKTIAENERGIILIEGRNSSDRPVVLEVYDKSGRRIVEMRFDVSFAPVEQMYRHKNLMAADGASGGKSDYATGTDIERLEPEDYPDSACNDKTFVFVHGYNVNPQSARGWNAEMFKRLHQSGSKAKFIGTTWNGAETQISGMEITVNYHKNVDHAFQTAKGTAGIMGLASYMNSLGEDTVVAAHSLGNIAVASALSDWNVSINTYFMINAAVPLEAFDLQSDPPATNPSMVHPQWLHYRNDWHASEWHTLFAPTDGRSKLTWRGRLSKLQGTIYNFYSSREEVLAEHSNTLGDPSILDIAYTNGRIYLGKYAWALQEKLKGRIHELQGFPIVGSVYGGWGFTQNFGHPPHIPSPSEAGEIAESTLQTEPLFDPGYKVIEHSPSPEFPLGYATRQMHSPAWVADLTDPAKGSETARNHLNTLLTEMFPATTAATGANKLVRIGESRNIDMQVEFKTGWPAERPDSDWRHSDIREVAYRIST